MNNLRIEPSSFRKKINTVGTYSIGTAALAIIGLLAFQLFNQRQNNSTTSSLDEHKQKIIKKNELEMITFFERIRDELENHHVVHGIYPSFKNYKEIDRLNFYSQLPNIDKDSSVRSRKGYFIRLHLFESDWWCYAWPEKYQVSGINSFYLERSGQFRWTEQRFEGSKKPARNKDAWADVYSFENGKELLSE